MTRPSIKTSMIGIFLLIGTILAGFSGMSISAMSTLNASTKEISEKWLPSVEVVKNIKIAFWDKRIAYAKHILSLTPEDMRAVETDIATKSQAMSGAIKAYEPLISSDSAGQLLRNISAAVATYDRQATEMLELSRAKRTEDATKIFTTVMPEQTKKVAELVDQLVKINIDGAQNATVNSDATFSKTIGFVYLAIGIAALVMLGAAVFIMSGVVKPIMRITGSMGSLAGGDTAISIPFAGRADEIGSMAGAVEVFRQAAITNKQLEMDAEGNRRQAEAKRNADQQQTEEAAERMRIATTGLAAGLKQLASGDLAFQLNDAFAPDFEALRQDFNQSVSQLGQALSAISDSISAMDDGTREISSGAQDLSKRTEQQAASLEETAAALDQITANVSNSAKRSEEARAVATQANQSAIKSAEVVSHAEEAMSRIETSSQQISNIIGVIDEIAFQTNLLALNAGVEAARAGDAGKGFAVVAQEVRELAQRSAAAAKEIKGLIQNSSTEVESGVKLVRDAGQALKTIGGFITEINHHMDSIATSAKEQSIGLAEVNTAVNSMDQTTQQNAAMVEQSTAASASLAVEAEKLRDLVAQFTLEGRSSEQSTTLRQTARLMAVPSLPSFSKPASRPVLPYRATGNVALAQGSWEEF